MDGDIVASGPWKDIWTTPRRECDDGGETGEVAFDLDPQRVPDTAIGCEQWSGSDDKYLSATLRESGRDENAKGDEQAGGRGNPGASGGPTDKGAVAEARGINA